MFVRYKDEKYICKFKDKSIITIIKIKLFLKRYIRLFKIAFPRSDLLLYILIICLWFIFAGLTNIIDFQSNHAKKSYFLTLWDLRNSMFSSVVLALAIGSFNHIKEYKTTLKRQHYTYADSMDDFEELIKAVDDADIWLMFHPMYNKHCFRECINYLDNKNIKINVNNNDFMISISIVQERITMIEQELKTGYLLVKDEALLNYHLSSAKKLLSKVILNENPKEFKKFLICLFEIVNQLRYVWRKDEKNDSQIISILDKYDINNISNDFYKRMLLQNFKLNSLDK